jgi:uncharacterized protein (TIGR02145 family)
MTNTAKSQLSHFFKNTPSSAFNQFKHLLVLSLLITFSFSARTALGSITTVVTFDSNSRTKVQCVETKARILFNGQTYGLITSPYTGRTWLDRNLGATRTAISSTDAAAYGDLYQWGRKQDGHESRTSGTTSAQKDSIFSTTDKFITGSFDWVSAGVDNDGSKRASVWIDGEANDICPVGFNVPTKMDLENEMTLAGIDAPNTLDKAFSSFLRIPAAGFRNRATGGAILNTVSLAALWTRNASVSTGGVQQAKYLSIDRTGANYNSLDRAYGMSVRCIKSKLVTLEITDDTNGKVRAGKFVTFKFEFSKPVFGFTIKDVNIKNGTIKAGTTLTPVRTDNTLWTLVVRPAQEEDRNSGKPSKVSFLSVTVPAGSVVGTKDNENATKSSRRIELQTAPSFRSLWAVDASVNNNPSLADRITGIPDSRLELGDRQQLNDPHSWIEARVVNADGSKNYGSRAIFTLTYAESIYIRSIVIRETFNTREGGQTVWGIDSEGNQVRLYGFGRDTVVPANSNLRGFVNDRTIMLRPEVRKKGPFKIIKIVVGSGYRETPDAVDAIQINGTLEPPI